MCMVVIYVRTEDEAVRRYSVCRLSVGKSMCNSLN